MIVRMPVPALRPFVSQIWASEGSGQQAGRREIALPTGAMHLVVRASGAASAVVAADGGASPLPAAVIGGVRDCPYRRVAGAGRSVGAMLRPGAAAILLGVPARPLAFAHHALGDVWAAGEAAALHEQVSDAPDLSSALGAFEEVLARRIGNARADSAIAMATRALGAGAGVGAVVAHLGWSHRHFIRLFTDHVGLAPAAYRRVRRFDRLVDLAAANPDTPLAALAATAGYADQAHMSRDFRGFSGLTPGAYRRLAPADPRHVPLH